MAKLAIMLGKPSDEDMEDQDGSDADDHGDTGESGGMEKNELCVPLKAVAVPDESEKAVAPEVGDVVNVDLKAKVTRVEGESVYLEPQEANGEQIPGADDDDHEEPDSDDQLRSDMQGPAGQQNMY